MSTTARSLVVAGESPWPARSGGTVRTAALIDALREIGEVTVAIPGGALEAPAGVHTVALPRSTVGRGRAHAGFRPRLGVQSIAAQGRRTLHDLVAAEDTDLVLFAHSYLAAAVGSLPVPVRVIDFANIERRRQASFAAAGAWSSRIAATVERVKAARWEPRVARDSSLTVAVDDEDARELQSWGARTVVVTNAYTRPGQPLAASPARGPVTYVASMAYAPNRRGGEALLDHVWPRIRARIGDARLTLAGKDADDVFGWSHQRDGVEVIGDPVSVEPLLARASLVVVPVTHGGGTQLKVAQALGLGRVPVVSRYGERSIPPDARQLCSVADDWDDFADRVCALLDDVEARHQREAALRALDLPDWHSVCAPFIRIVSDQIAAGAA